MRRRLILSLVPALVLLGACSDDAPNEFDAGSGADSSGTATDTGTPTDMPETGGESMTTSGDGDGDPAGDGDGDPAGDGDPTGPVCGNGIVELGEQCDGDDLDGNTCETLGYVGGELLCDPVMCTYDASMCETDMGSTGGTTG